ncbi:glycogen synthase [Elizabethkingia miricola]|nr:glycogen synthase [Elizabethkingia miricola]
MRINIQKKKIITIMYDQLDIYHISMECYPVAKVGGLADVVGALPKYQNMMGAKAKVVMPWYNKPFVHQNKFEVIFENTVYLDGNPFYFEILQEESDTLGFELYLVKIHGLTDRDEVYGYRDESMQFIAFQRAVLQWLCWEQRRPDILHCHDYHAGLIPFFTEYCHEYSFLKGVKTIGTIHNGQYQGHMSWEMARFFPEFDQWKWGLLDWDKCINPLAVMIKNAHAFNAVSEGYLEELLAEANGLEELIRQERAKAYGIINGIDTEVWDPKSDPMMDNNYTLKTFAKKRELNKTKLCDTYELNPELPLYAFIGRFAKEKGADVLPDLISRCIWENEGKLNFIVLGSGDKGLEDRFRYLKNVFYVNLAVDLGYKEQLSHQIYSSADFLLMPSRVEPCGLNQMYSMRYGTMPIVRLTGGLKDTVKDIGDDGYGITFRNFNMEDMLHAVNRSLYLYYNLPSDMKDYQKKMMKIDFSWEKSAEKYLNLYMV